MKGKKIRTDVQTDRPKTICPELSMRGHKKPTAISKEDEYLLTACCQEIALIQIIGINLKKTIKL